MFLSGTICWHQIIARLNLPAVTEMLIMRDLHYGRMCFESLGSLFLAVGKASAFGLDLFHS